MCQKKRHKGQYQIVLEKNSKKLEMANYLWHGLMHWAEEEN